MLEGEPDIGIGWGRSSELKVGVETNMVRVMGWCIITPPDPTFQCRA